MTNRQIIEQLSALPEQFLDCEAYIEIETWGDDVRARIEHCVDHGGPVTFRGGSYERKPMRVQPPAVPIVQRFIPNRGEM